MRTRIRAKWSNQTGRYQVEPLQYLIPETLSDVVKAVQRAERTHHRIRAVGAGHSYSDIAITDGYLLDMHCLKHMLPLNKEQLKADYHPVHLVEVEAGITIHDLNRQLDKQGLALTNMGAIDKQTLAGAISTGTHGAGRNLPALSGMVRSMVIVAAEGKIYRIEPENGITDPALHDEAKVTLIQDDAVFNSAVVSLGYMGIIYSYILEVRPLYWLYENRSVEKWSDVRRQLLDKSIFNDYPIQVNNKLQTKPVRSIFIVVNPFRIKGNHTCMVARTFEIDKPGFLPFKDRTRALLSTIISRIPVFFYLTLLIVNYLPKLVPLMLERSIKAVRDTTYIHKSYKVLYQGFEFVASQGQGAEFAYDMHQSSYLKALDKVFEKVKQLSSEFKLYPSSAPTLRFVKASQSYITPEYQQDVCYVGNPVLVRQKGANLILNEYQNIHLKYGGRPHWGKVINQLDAQPELIRQWYNKLDVWQQVMVRFNPNGTFLNSFAERKQMDEL